MSRRRARVEALGLALALAACAPPFLPPVSSRPGPSAPANGAGEVAALRFADLSGWAEDRQEQALAALLRSCAALARQPDDRPMGPAARFGRAGDWKVACVEAGRVEPGDQAARAFFEGAFRPLRLRAQGGAERGLLTGYYEPVVRGARTRSARYATPLYRKPAAPTTLERAAIETGGLAGTGLELLWLDDAVDAFFLHVQGSGQVELEGGGRLRVGYAGDNGRPYVAIGRVLVQRGALAQDGVTLDTIRAWLRANPGEAPALMRSNPRYVFFRVVEGDGPVGSAGVALTAGRSLAVDPAHIPLGAPLWLDAPWPGDGTRPLRRLAIAQDTGGAIKGPVRADLFWGAGPEAEALAGRMKEPGTLAILVPKAIAARLARLD